MEPTNPNLEQMSSQIKAKKRRRVTATWIIGTCDVCENSGIYPIIDRHGRQIYQIKCPQCGGGSQ